MPSRKGPRLEASTSIRTSIAAEGADTFCDAQTTDIGTTASPDDTGTVCVAPVPEAHAKMISESLIDQTLDPSIEETGARAGKWTSQEDAALTEGMQKHGKNWADISALIPGRTKKQCRRRVQSLDTIRTRGPYSGKRAQPRGWTPEEDAKLTNAVTKYCKNSKDGNNWVQVAAMVPGRTNYQCRRRWGEHLDPTVHEPTERINISKWKPEEDAKLTDAVKKYGSDWPRVKALVPGRTIGQCYRRWPNLNVNEGKWTLEEDAKLILAVRQRGSDFYWNYWVTVAAMVPDRTNSQCRTRWDACLAPAITQTTTTDISMGKWTPEEDAKLIEAVQKCGDSWVAVAKLVPGRTNIQCQQRWTSNLGPIITETTVDRTVDSRWSPAEDAKLTAAVKQRGDDWVLVSLLVPGRTNEQCQKRWNKSLNPDIKNGFWTPEEDANLTEAVKKCGSDWPRVSALVKGRTNGQCSVRWRKYLENTVDPEHSSFRNEQSTQS
jgi:hypothetical protein